MIKKLITHKNCPDGLASAMILNQAYPDIEIQFVQYDTPEHKNLTAEPGLIFCDFSPPRERVQEFVDIETWVLDHHKHQEDVVKMFGARGLFADEKKEPGISGASLALYWAEESRPSKWLPPIAHFAYLVGVRDTWQTQDPRWKEACALSAALMFFKPERWLKEARCYLTQPEMELGYRLIERQEEEVEKLCAEDSGKLYTFKLGDSRVAAFYDPSVLISDAAERLREVGYNLVVGFHYPSVGQVKCSLRSDGSVDVGKIAHVYGGGGHTKAAGFTVSSLAEHACIESLLKRAL